MIDKLLKLYAATNAMMTELGARGEINLQHPLAITVDDALDAVDDGKINPELLPTQPEYEAVAWRYQFADWESQLGIHPAWSYSGHNCKGDLPAGAIIEPLFARTKIEGGG